MRTLFNKHMNPTSSDRVCCVTRTIQSIAVDLSQLLLKMQYLLALATFLLSPNVTEVRFFELSSVS